MSVSLKGRVELPETLGTRHTTKGEPPFLEYLCINCSTQEKIPIRNEPRYYGTSLISFPAPHYYYGEQMSSKKRETSMQYSQLFTHLWYKL